MSAGTSPASGKETHSTRNLEFIEGSCIINRLSPNPKRDSQDSYEFWHQHSEIFIDQIQKARREGYGFVPFIGAGFSAPSGAPLVNELQWYLQRCIFLALQHDRDKRWRPRTDQWPPLHQWPPLMGGGENEEKLPVLAEDHWSIKILSELNALVGRTERPSDYREEFAARVQGYGSATEWRTALLFLSRLDHGPRQIKNPLSMTAPRQEIIDSCLRAVLKEKYPTLEHKMLAVLAGALRLDLVLTTNFDDLLEKAFAATRNPLEVFEVHLEDDLPHWSAVSEVRALVKLHGNKHSLRADHSLDTLPSEEDKQRFLEYLLSARGRNALIGEPKGALSAMGPLDFQNYLLVMGCSGKEERTLAFIEHAWKHLGKEFGVFWLCHSDEDVKRIAKRTARFYDQRKDPEWKGSIILRHPNLGLLLLQLYQTIRRNLPPSGGLFPSVSRLTLPPLPTTYALPTSKTVSGPNGSDEFTQRVIDRLRSFRSDSNWKTEKLLVVAAGDTARGVTSACSKIFREMEKDSVCLWLDMNDISSADSLFEMLLEAAYFRLGMENWVPVYRETEESRRIREIDRLARSINKHWVIFLNARETPGANTDQGPNLLNKDRPHGWMDDSEAQIGDAEERDAGLADSSSCARSFINLLRPLCGFDSPRISVVLMCRTGHAKPGLIVQLVKEDWLAQENHIILKPEMSEAILFPEEQIVVKAIEWTQSTDEKRCSKKRRFLHALVLMQRPRLLSTIWSDAVSLKDTDFQAEEERETEYERENWLNQLEDLGLVRRKAGGFIWLHLRCRQLLRDILQNPEHLNAFIHPVAREILQKWKAREREAEIHTELAKWYEKVLDASENPSAVFEALHHLCMAAQGFSDPDQTDYNRAAQRLDTASALLKANGFLIQTQGYARGSCRRLADIRALCRSLEEHPNLEKAARRLRIVCTEVKRAIAHEVGEDAKGYLRHRQFAELHVLDSGKLLTQTLQQGKDHTQHLSQQFIKELPSTVKEDAVQSASKLMRWFRWSGMLAMASRSYSRASTAFEQAFRPLDEHRQPLSWFQEVLNSEPQPQNLLIERVRLIEQHVELLLLKNSLGERLKCFGVAKKDFHPLTDVFDIEKKIAEGRKLVAEIRSHDHSTDSHDTIGANWCESRLLIHYSVCASLKFKLIPRKPGDYRWAANQTMGLLGDAEAILRVSDSRRFRAELAMVELHRAEARLRSAEAVSLPGWPGSSDRSFADMCTQFRQIPLKLGLQGNDLAILKELKHKPDLHTALRQAKALVADGLRFLDRAEPVLRERRRNVWWTTWFFERRLRLIAMFVWASIFEDATPVPFLGLEAAAHDTQSLADELLDSAIRMISVDAYRLATIIDAYASCAKALKFRLQLDSSSFYLSSRQRQMGKYLSGALNELDDVIRRRDYPEFGLNENDMMDEEVMKYVKAVKEEARKIHQEIEQ